MSDDTSVVGKGAEIMLPPQGNPFKKDQSPKASKGAGAPSGDEPADLSPADVAAKFGSPAGSDEEPMDLSPEDIAARFPSTADERNAVPSAAVDTDSARTPVFNKAPRFDLEPTPSSETPAVIPVDAVPLPVTATTATMADSMRAASETAVAPADSMAASMPEPAPVTEAVVSMESAPAMSAPTPSTPAVGFQPYNPFAPAAEPSALSEPTAASVPAVAPVPATPPALPRQGGSAVIAVEVRPDELDQLTKPSGTLDYAKTPVTEDEFILQMLVTDERIDELWERIDKAERVAISDDNSLQDQREENLESLKIARNLLMGGRQNYEDAVRYVVEVESHMFYAKRVWRWSYSYGFLVLFYGLFWIALLASGLRFAAQIVAFQEKIGFLDDATRFGIWFSILAGGLGGVSKSLFSLTSHVSKQDFNRQHMMWYINSPIVGSVLGIFVYFVMQVGVFAINAGGGNVANSGVIVYILAWVVGFQQNVALSLVDQVIKTVIKPDDKEDKGS